MIISGSRSALNFCSRAGLSRRNAARWHSSLAAVPPAASLSSPARREGVETRVTMLRTFRWGRRAWQHGAALLGAAAALLVLSRHETGYQTSKSVVARLPTHLELRRTARAARPAAWQPRHQGSAAAAPRPVPQGPPAVELKGESGMGEQVSHPGEHGRHVG